MRNLIVGAICKVNEGHNEMRKREHLLREALLASHHYMVEEVATPPVVISGVANCSHPAEYFL